jgi:hypothetical protein
MSVRKPPHAKRRATIGVPVLKMPPELALSAIRILGDRIDQDSRTLSQRLHLLRPSIPTRTLINAYVIPSLKELDLYAGTLANGKLTRFGQVIYESANTRKDGAKGLMARQLAAIDARRVRLTQWLADVTNQHEHDLRKKMLYRFLTSEWPDPARTQREEKITFDRLGKWLSYLVYFGVVREILVGGRPILTTNHRQLEALRLDPQGMPPLSVQRAALLDSYSRLAMRLGTRLYLPIPTLRDEFGRILEKQGFLLTDDSLNEILKRAPTILADRLVTYSPYSGPASSGLVINNMYAGFISIRAAGSANPPVKE